MVWRGSTDFKDRFFAAIVYLIPIYYALSFFGLFLLSKFPPLRILEILVLPVAIVYGSFPFAGLIIFFILFMAVVRNERIHHFIRFNTLQAILFDILLIVLQFFLQIVTQGLGQNLIVQTLFNVIFLAAIAACGYSIYQSALGRYAEIPGISEAVYAQVR